MVITDLQLVFVHIPKCAGRSIAQAFGLVFDHHTVHEFAGEEFSAMYKFAVVRNTWDRMVSMYHYIRDCPWHVNTPVWGSRGFDTPFKMWLRENLAARQPDFLPEHTCGQRSKDSELGSPFWFSSQLAWIGYGKDQILVDRVLRFENLREGFEDLCRELDLQASLPHVNASRKRLNYRAYYDTETRNLVAEHYADEIEAFGFQF